MTARVHGFPTCPCSVLSNSPIQPLVNCSSVMSDPEQQLSDAEKMRLKRLARLGGSSTPTQQAPATTEPPPNVTETTSAPREPPAAGSRLLNLRSEASEHSQQAGPSSSSILNKAAKPAKASSPGPALLGKRPSSAATSARTPQPPPDAPRAAPAPARLSVPYPEWEAQRVQAVFSVTLNVSCLVWLKADCSATRSRKERLETLLAQGTTGRDRY